VAKKTVTRKSGKEAGADKKGAGKVLCSQRQLDTSGESHSCVSSPMAEEESSLDGGNFRSQVRQN